MEPQAPHTWYDIIRDFSSPVMYLIQNVILAVTAIFALRTIKQNDKNANDQIANQDRVAKKRATLDLILNMVADVKYNEARSVIFRMRNDAIDPGRLSSEMKDKRLPEEDRKQAAERFRACQYVLGRFELFASGIRTNVLDEEAFKSHYYSTYMMYLDYLMPYIVEVRKMAASQTKDKSHVSADTIYQEVVALFEDWKLSPLSQR